MIKKLLAGLTLTLALLASLSVVTTAPAQATDTCISVPEVGGPERNVAQDPGPHPAEQHGHFEGATRSGYNGRLLQTWRGYDSCEYPDDEVHATFDDYTAPGTRTRGGYRRLLAGTWMHWCQDYEYIHDANARVTGYSLLRQPLHGRVPLRRPGGAKRGRRDLRADDCRPPVTHREELGVNAG
jgi:hypothetical protein